MTSLSYNLKQFCLTFVFFSKGFDDAGFMVDYPAFSILGSSRFNITKTGWTFWNVTLEGSPCVAQYPTEPWRCILGPEPTEATQQPLFTFIALYDQVFLFILGSPMPPNNPESTNYSIGYGAALHSALCNSSKPFFAHSGCVHTIVVSNSFFSVKINDYSFYDTLVDWFLGLNRLPHRAIENVDCYCTRQYNCNPTDPCDPGPGYQNGCVYQYCPGFNPPPNSSSTNTPVPSTSPPRPLSSGSSSKVSNELVAFVGMIVVTTFIMVFMATL
jgi:hypothetical protein